ncbi:DUF4349 domain-containing protein [Nonomuraea sp. LPB2021202275-12-8]|uniref:DUF4349 domain-containing protein n=1 Tax=Nonomuraea sp. LPB2021202275-12-8 TaxID=3120159 RepID=UPI00300CD1E5
MRRHQIGVALTAACAALLLSGCGSGATMAPASSADSAGGAPEHGQVPDAEAQARAPRETAADSDLSRPVPEKTGGAGNIASKVQVTQQERQVIYTASMTVRAKDVTASAQQAKQIVTTAGGHLAREESSSAEETSAKALLEFKIPPARYPEVLGSLGKNLGKQLRLEQGTQDVTLQVADVESRLKSAQQALDSLRTLLKKADTIGQVLQVEREIAGREADLESLQAQQKELATQVGMATLTLQLVGPAAVVTEPTEEPAGFLGGLKSGWESLVAFLKVLLTVLGTVLPWLVVVAPVLVLAIVLLRRRRPERQAAVPAAETQPS